MSPIKNAVDRAVERILSGRESVQVLVNNAGVSELYMFEDTTDDILDAHINVNLKGTWYMTQAVIGRMRAHRYGRIINMASVTGPMVCDRGFSAYA